MPEKECPHIFARAEGFSMKKLKKLRRVAVVLVCDVHYDPRSYSLEFGFCFVWENVNKVASLIWKARIFMKRHVRDGSRDAMGLP